MLKLVMINWSTDEEKFKKKHPQEYKVWHLTQLINYGLDGEKIKLAEIKELWHQIKNRLDPYRARVLEYLIWGKLFSLPNNLSFWNLPPKIQKS